MAFTLSPSSLSLFKDCPRCFWLQERTGKKRPAFKYPSLPLGIDMALKKRFDYFREHGKFPPELQHLKDTRLYDSPLLALWRKGYQGLRCKDIDGNILIGAVDEVLEQNGKLAILECTTRGFPLKKDTPELYQDQLNLYSFLLHKNGYQVSEYAYILFYYPKEVNWQGDMWFHKRLYARKISLVDAEKLWKRALAVLQNSIPAPSENCEFCKWKME